MCLAQGPQRSDAGEARVRGPSVSSQANLGSTTSAHESGITDNFNSGLTEAIFDKVTRFLLHCILIALY